MTLQSQSKIQTEIARLSGPLPLTCSVLQPTRNEEFNRVQKDQNKEAKKVLIIDFPKLVKKICRTWPNKLSSSSTDRAAERVT